MKFKLDENLPVEVAELFRTHGHNARTVLEQNLGGAKDPDLAVVCQQEQRAIVTLDTDFSDIRSYPPQKYSGIVVFRLGSQAREHVMGVAMRFLLVLGSHDLSGQLELSDSLATTDGE